ncbi:MAG TPA: metallopeptidase TldD-related protein [Chryseolinea sp.]
MNRYFCHTLLLLLFLVNAIPSFAQGQTDDVILKAMQDELNRNMADLKLPNYDKPFFIMYGIQDQKDYTITATLGSLVRSTEKSFRFKTNTRVLVGDYSFNDESLEDNLTSAPTALEIALPLDDDYIGIRRSLWSSTDKVYRDAARHFQRHQQTLKETGKALADIPHRSFAKGSPIKVVSAHSPYSFDKSKWEQQLKKLSSLFLHHPSIQNSTVIMQFTEGYKYLVNSEGVVAKIPFRKTSFMSVGQLKNAEGEFAWDQVSHQTFLPDELPSEDQLKKEIEDMIVALEKQLSIPKFEDEYNGPVLLVGPVVADVFSSVLFSGPENILASNTIPRLTGFQYQAEPLMDTKIGKSVFHESLTIKAKPKLKSYNGTVLASTFEIDDEGIVPKDELTIVEKGVLKNLLNDRTITHPTQSANGFSGGPGVLEVTSTQKNSEKELKEKLITKAKSEGLDYALIIRNSPALMGIMNVYKVSINDGSEELVRNAVYDGMNFKTLKRILGASETYIAHNLNVADLQGTGQNGGMGSYIVPNALLIEDMQVNQVQLPILKEEEYVANPLLQGK